MSISNFSIQNLHFFAKCHSDLYSAHTSFDKNTVSFDSGISILNCDIDEQGWALSYFIPMYNFDNIYIAFKDNNLTNRIKERLHTKKYDIILENDPKITINGADSDMKTLSEQSCYIDNETYPLFRTNKSVRYLIESGIKKYRIPFTADEIIQMFHLCEERCNRPLKYVGNERFRAMSAIGLAHSKEIFCFPWLSKKYVDYLGLNLRFALKVLEDNNKTIIFPTNSSIDLSVTSEEIDLIKNCN